MQKGRTPDVVLALVVTGRISTLRFVGENLRSLGADPLGISGDELDRTAFSQEASTTPPPRWLRRLLQKSL